MDYFNNIDEVLKAQCRPTQRRCYTASDGYFIAEGWQVKAFAEAGEVVIDLSPYEVVEKAQDWGILRTCGVASVFYGTRVQAICHVREMNINDVGGASDIVTRGMSPEEARQWLEDMKCK
jgi:hypothetical protein